MQFARSATARQRRELSAFARYCIFRLERELGRHEGWVVEIQPMAGNYVTRIAVQEGDAVIEASGVGLDGALSTWEAICRIEESMREVVAPQTKSIRLQTCSN